MKMLDLKPKEHIDLEPSEFVRRFKNERDRFSSFRIMPPALGSGGFGTIRVKLTVPIYELEDYDESDR